MAWYKFWIKSSRGTDQKAYVWILPWGTRADMKEEATLRLERWCEQFGAWHHADNFVSYGHRRVAAPPTKELKEQIKGELKRKAASVKKLALLRAELRRLTSKSKSDSSRVSK